MTRPVFTVAIILLMPVLVLASGCEARVNEDEPIHLDLLPRLSSVEEIRIGSVDDPVAGFSNIRGVTVADNGEVFVLEPSANEVRVFSPEGSWLRTIGRGGQGPGEFTSPSSFGLIGDTLWVFDSRQRRISWFLASGELIFATSSNVVPITLEDSGIPVEAFPSRPMSNGLIESDISYPWGLLTRPYRVPIIRFDREGAVVDSAGWRLLGPQRTVQLGGRNLVPPALQPTSPISSVIDSDSIVVKWQDTQGQGLLEVIRRDEHGDTLFHRRLQYTPVPVPESVVDSLMEGALFIAPMLGVGEGEVNRRMRPAIDLPPSRPPIETTFVGKDGSLWIKLPAVSNGASDWVLVEANGTPAGRVALSSGIRMMWASGTAVWAVDADDLDVPWLVRLSVR